MLFGQTPIRRISSDKNKCSEEDSQDEGYLNWVVGEDLSRKGPLSLRQIMPDVGTAIKGQRQG